MTVTTATRPANACAGFVLKMSMDPFRSFLALSSIKNILRRFLIEQAAYAVNTILHHESQSPPPPDQPSIPWAGKDWKLKTL